MKNLDAGLIAIVFVVWAGLAAMYATIPMIYMPPAIRVWGAGALLFLALAGVIAVAEITGRSRRRSNGPAPSDKTDTG